MPWTLAKHSTTPALDESENIQKIQATVVQHHYVRARLAQINATDSKLDVMRETMAALAPIVIPGKKLPKNLIQDKRLWDAFWSLTKRIQDADMTINFKAAAWFLKPNTYKSYTQVYERSVQTVNGQNVLRMGTGDKTRIGADAKVTFTQQMQAATPANSGIMRVMDLGKMKSVGGLEVEASNPYFNPKSKQVFAAMNYARYPHGAAHYYGGSYMVLNPKFKTNAIYYAADTFLVGAGAKVSVEHQLSYNLLGGIYAKAKPAMQSAMVSSCLFNQALPDPGSVEAMDILLEGHIFGPLDFSGNIESLHISNQSYKGETYSQTEWAEIQKNARAFALANGAKIYWTD